MFAVMVAIAARASFFTAADLLASMIWFWRVMCALYAAIERVACWARVAGFADFATVTALAAVFDLTVVFAVFLLVFMMRISGCV
jgi:hypothetical protein